MRTALALTRGSEFLGAALITSAISLTPRGDEVLGKAVEQLGDQRRSLIALLTQLKA